MRVVSTQTSLGYFVSRGKIAKCLSQGEVFRWKKRRRRGSDPLRPLLEAERVERRHAAVRSELRPCFPASGTWAAEQSLSRSTKNPGQEGTQVNPIHTTAVLINMFLLFRPSVAETPGGPRSESLSYGHTTSLQTEHRGKSDFLGD